MRQDKIINSNEKENYTEEGFILPKHYMRGSMQTIDIIQDQLSDKSFFGFCKFLIIKYLIRVEDSDMEAKIRSYTKASYYLNELIARRAKLDKTADESRIKPVYYAKHQYEIVDIVEDQFDEEELIGAYVGVIMKYILRSDHKHGVEDYQKADYFLARLIKYCKKQLENKAGSIE